MLPDSSKLVSDKTRTVQIAEEYNLTLLYLPPYSPELNPVENKWAVVKQKVKLSINDFDSLHDCVKYCSV